MFTTIYLFFVMMFGGAEGVENTQDVSVPEIEVVGTLGNGGGGCPGGICEGD